MGVLWESKPGSDCVVRRSRLLLCFCFNFISSPCGLHPVLSSSRAFALYDFCVPLQKRGSLALSECRILLQEQCGTVGSCALGASDCRALLHGSSPSVIWCLRLRF
jgi:hypothetical protein